MAAVIETNGVNRDEEDLKKLQAETYKLLVEALKVNQERRWPPFIVTTTFFAAGATFIKVLDMLMKG
ncbi:hypothetical protein L2Y96_14980 [Luteibacter aegosomaticola]|uniref:hypothetical protein n=1 Tax=Luteibacter aegosomaticola TaxID=2911538 RepID=UPI001FF8ACC3|nr:hypothetical protein [Luteibacter aegosomaticola]UPG88706.1 hypothetical protein L2Y96_14980 [Luteibacter aegosomaticola]